MSNWLITGGCGFIGRNLVLRLLKMGAGIRVLDNCAVCGPADLGAVCSFTGIEGGGNRPEPGDVQFMKGDIRSEKDALEACLGMDVIVHLAANTGVPKSVADPVLDFQANALGTFQMLEAARTVKTKKFIFASSGAPAGNATPPVNEKMPPKPISPYGASKLAGEGYCSAYNHCFGLDTVSLRFSNVYGPWSAHKTSVVAKLITGALAGREWEIYGDGSQTRDFLHVDDLVNAICLAAETAGAGGEVFQIATGKEHTLVQLVEHLRAAMLEKGIQSPELRYESPRMGDMPRNYADPSKAREVLGWKAEIDLEDGLRETMEWYAAGRK